MQFREERKRKRESESLCRSRDPRVISSRRSRALHSLVSGLSFRPPATEAAAAAATASKFAFRNPLTFSLSLLSLYSTLPHFQSLWLHLALLFTRVPVSSLDITRTHTHTLTHTASHTESDIDSQSLQYSVCSFVISSVSVSLVHQLYCVSHFATQGDKSSKACRHFSLFFCVCVSCSLCGCNSFIFAQLTGQRRGEEKRRDEKMKCTSLSDSRHRKQGFIGRKMKSRGWHG